MAWSLTDTLNTDVNNGGGFDSLPESQEKLRSGAEALVKPDQMNYLSRDGGKIDERQVISPISKLEQPTTEFNNIESGRADAAIVDNRYAKNPLREFAPVEVAQKQQQEQQDAQDWSIGKYFTVFAGALQKADALQKENDFGNHFQRGANKAKWSAIKSAAMEELADHMENKLGIPREEVAPMFQMLVKLPGGGFRTREQIDQLDKIRREGVSFTNEEGRKVAIEKDLPWENVIQVDKAMTRAAISGKEAKTTDPIKDVNDINTAIKGYQKDGVTIPGNEEAVDALVARRDALLNLPQGAGRLQVRVARLFEKNEQLQQAKTAGLPEHDGVARDQYDTEISSNLSKIVSESIKYAPSFKNTQERDAWLSNSETKNLPFKLKIGSGTAVVFPTEDPNKVLEYSPNGKAGATWITHVLGQPQAPANAKEAPATANVKEPKHVNAPREYTQELVENNLGIAADAKQKLDKMWRSGYAVSPDKAQREEYAEVKSQLDSANNVVKGKIRALEQEVRDSGYPNFKGDPKLNSERMKQIKQLKQQL